MKIYFSVISHYDEDIIKQLDTCSRLTKQTNVTVICRDNTQSNELREYCRQNKVHYIRNDQQCGFARNNNLNFLYAQFLGMTDSDFFVLLNPDIYIDEGELDKYISTLRHTRSKMLTPNLFLNQKFTTYDDHLRYYPTVWNFIKNYLADDRSTVVDKTLPLEVNKPYWSSGAFLAINSQLYRSLNGLDEGFILYCEDINFCGRAGTLGYQVEFLSDIIAIHYHRRASKKFLSREFFLHVRSVVVYAMTNLGWRTQKSCLFTENEQLYDKSQRCRES